MSNFVDFLQTLAPLLGFKKLRPPQTEALMVLVKASQTQMNVELDQNIVPNTILFSSMIAEVPLSIEKNALPLILKKQQDPFFPLSLHPENSEIHLYTRLSPDIPKELLDEILKAYILKVIESRKFVQSVLQELDKPQLDSEKNRPKGLKFKA